VQERGCLSAVGDVRPSGPDADSERYSRYFPHARMYFEQLRFSFYRFTPLRSHMEGFWSLLRSWLRPHRGISQEHLPLYLGFFEFVHNAQNRGKGLMDSLLGLLLR